MSALYVCLFSNGHLKVGRSVNALARISHHEARVSCLGVELVDYRVFDCVAHPGPAEAALIDRCVDACSKRNKNEWFEGVDFDSACEWAAECASTQTGIDEAIGVMGPIQDALTALRRTMSQAEIAKAIGVNQSRISRWEGGDVSSGAEAAAKLIALADKKTADASTELATPSKEAADA